MKLLQKVKHTLTNNVNGKSTPAKNSKDITSLLLNAVAPPLAYINSRYEYSHFNKSFADLFDITFSFIGKPIRNGMNEVVQKHMIRSLKFDIPFRDRDGSGNL